MVDLKVYENLTARQQLNLFRGLYYNDGNATEKGIIANAINDILPEYNRLKAEAKIRRGNWTDNRYGTFTCLVCGGNALKMDYCGRCGADMRGENNDR